jgi:hypothetical protein
VGVRGRRQEGFEALPPTQENLPWQERILRVQQTTPRCRFDARIELQLTRGERSCVESEVQSLDGLHLSMDLDLSMDFTH